MKINWKYIIMLLSIGLLTACEVIPEGEREEVIFTPTDPSTLKRTSLLIEYSGWQCVNCPTAAEEAHRLKELYGENLVVVVMHPETNPNTSYKNAAGKPNEAVNYTCPEADSIYLPRHTGNAQEEERQEEQEGSGGKGGHREREDLLLPHRPSQHRRPC